MVLVSVSEEKPLLMDLKAAIPDVPKLQSILNGGEEEDMPSSSENDQAPSDSLTSKSESKNVFTSSRTGRFSVKRRKPDENSQ